VPALFKSANRVLFTYCEIWLVIHFRKDILWMSDCGVGYSVEFSKAIRSLKCYPFYVILSSIIWEVQTAENIGPLTIFNSPSNCHWSPTGRLISMTPIQMNFYSCTRQCPMQNSKCIPTSYKLYVVIVFYEYGTKYWHVFYFNTHTVEVGSLHTP
jgi:hypothetical protein